MISGSIPAKFRGIPRNFAEFRRNLAEITSEVKKFRGIPCWRNSVDTLDICQLELKSLDDFKEIKYCHLELKELEILMDHQATLLITADIVTNSRQIRH